MLLKNTSQVALKNLVFKTTTKTFAPEQIHIVSDEYGTHFKRIYKDILEEVSELEAPEAPEVKEVIKEAKEEKAPEVKKSKKTKSKTKK